MVQAILDGRKTMTRRIIKPQPDPDSDGPEFIPVAPMLDWEEYYMDIWKPWHWETSEGESIQKFCPYGKENSLLYVRETWQKSYNEKKDKWDYIYKANGYYFDEDGPTKWKPGIHLPKEGSRIWLEVSDIKAERLQDISDEDILREGIRIPVSPQDGGILLSLGEEHSAWYFMPEQWQIDQYVENRGKEKYTPTEHDFLFAHWAEKWCEINGVESWNSNPWVWAISFKVLSTTGKP
jgi:hypothetical protein